MKTITAILFATLLATGCATQGTKFEMADVDNLRPGVTTIHEAQEKLGRPRAVKVADDGTQSVTWVWAQASIGGTQSRATRILFDKNGKMIRVASRVEH